MKRIIEPRQHASAAELVEEILEGHGFADDARILTEIFLAANLRGETEECEAHVEALAEELRAVAPSARGDTLVLLAIHLLQARHFLDEASVLALAPKLVKRGDVAVEGAFATASNAPSQLKLVVAALFAAGHVDPLKFIDREILRATTKGTGGPWDQIARENDPRLVDYWFALHPVQAFEHFERLLMDEPIESLGALALGLDRALMLQYSGSFTRTWPELAMGKLYPYVEPLSRALCRRRRAEKHEDDRTLTRVCWSYVRLAGERAPEIVPDDYKPLAELALKELTDLRLHLRSESAAQYLELNRDYLTQAVGFGLWTDPSSLWPVLRRLLLAMREMPARALPLDLRTWNEAGFDPIIEPWAWVLERISHVLEVRLGPESIRDRDLKELRRELAKFCLDRIKTRERVTNGEPTDEAFLERNATWRAAYMNAAKDLQPNLGKEGHHALLWAATHDPSSEARKAAREAADTIRHSRGLPNNTSPRRVVFTAFWRLRQAHVLSFVDEIDTEGAQRTLRKEMRRQADLEK